LVSLKSDECTQNFHFHKIKMIAILPSVVSHRLPILFATALLSACAISSKSFDSEIAEGRISRVQSVEGELASAGSYYPGQGGAVGAATAYLLRYANGTKAHSYYTIQRADGSERTFATDEKFEVGTCVAAFVNSANATNPYPKLGEVTIRSSDKCSFELPKS
jgi:hypothetical protein